MKYEPSFTAVRSTGNHPAASAIQACNAHQCAALLHPRNMSPPRCARGAPVHRTDPAKKNWATFEMLFLVLPPKKIEFG